MSIIARIRPSVETKAHRVSPAKPVPFGHGLIEYEAPRPWEKAVRVALANLGYDQQAQNSSVWWIISRQNLTHHPLISREHQAAVNGVLRASAVAPKGFRDLTPLPRVSALPIPFTPTPVDAEPARDTFRPYRPTDQDWSEYREMMDDLDAANREADLEMSYMASVWESRLSGVMTDEDVALVGAVG